MHSLSSLSLENVWVPLDDYEMYLSKKVPPSQLNEFRLAKRKQLNVLLKSGIMAAVLRYFLAKREEGDGGHALVTDHS